MEAVQLPQIAIIGCGWLGLPLGKKLAKEGCRVIGTTTTPAKLPLLEAEGIIAYLVDLHATEVSLQPFLSATTWILAFPPKTKSTTGEWYVRAISRIVDYVRQCKVEKIILLSSTSVYPDRSGTMDEETVLTEINTGNLAIWQAEQVVLKSGISHSYVLRLGGLTGEGRILARHFAGKEGLINGDSPVNLLHRMDAINSVSLFVHKAPKSGVYNVCSPVHPARKEVFKNDCICLNLPEPHFLPGGVQRIVSSDKLLDLGFSFLYPDPRNFFCK